MRVLLCVATVLTGLLVAGPAQADRASLKDATKDVHSPEGAHDWTDEGSVVNTDARRTVVAHRARSVKVTVHYAKLQERVSDEIEVSVRLRTASGTEYEVGVFVDWLFRGASVGLVDMTDYGLVECEGATARASLRKGTISFAISRSCLARPKWVKFLGTAESYTESDGLFVDNLMGATPEPSRWTRALRAG